MVGRYPLAVLPIEWLERLATVLPWYTGIAFAPGSGLARMPPWLKSLNPRMQHRLLALLSEPIRDTLKLGSRPENFAVNGYCMTYYDAACVHAALAKLALQDQGKPLAERQRLAQRDLDRTLELLDKARSTGEFKGMITSR